ncbi:hypothetical protein [Rhizobium leguminosarum]|uniref:hypothetical protein n=1 Tax=Rhizobium leguminosarum TaxID=384 RepID=UPI003F99D938
MKSYLRSVGIGAALGSVLAMWLFPVWQAWVFAFQTLITGFFAVGAAYLTVRQMQVTDKAAQLRHDELLTSAKQNEKEARERHNELVELTIRKDRLVVERLLVPSLTNLHINRQTDRLLVLPQVEDVDHQALQPFAERAQRCIDSIRSITNITIQPAWNDAAHLMDGFTSFHLREMVSCAHTTVELCGRIQTYPVSPLIDEDDDLMMLHTFRHQEAMKGKSMGALQEMVERYNFNAARIAYELNCLISGLEKLRKQYGLEV